MKKRLPEGALALRGAAVPDLMDALRRATPILLVVGVWLLCRPFNGIVHDGILYAGQALFRLDPATFGQDVFFAFGSQDDFTVYSALYAPLVGLLGPVAAAMAVVAAGQALWLSGATALVLRFAPARAAALAGIVLVAALPGTYGGWGVLNYGEGFATPRLLAEALGLWALWALCGGRFALAALLGAAAGVLHPIVSATVLGVGFVFLALADRRWLLVAVAAAAAVGAAAFLDTGPFGRLLQTMDPEWRAIVERRNGYLFPTLWQEKDWGWLVASAGLTLAGATLLSDWRRRLLLAVLFAGGAGLLVSLIGGDLFGNLLSIQIQPYRTLWLLQMFGYLSAGILFARLWRLREDGVPLIVAIVLSWVLLMFFSPALGAALVLAMLAFAVLRLRGAVRPLSSWLRTSVLVLSALLLLILIGGRLLYVKERLALQPNFSGVWPLLGSVTVIDIVAVAALAFCIVRFAPGVVRGVLPVAAVAMFIVGAASWDRRSDWPDLMTAARPSQPFPGVLDAAGAQVFWEGDVRGAWLLLDRPSYVSTLQGAGLAFNRRTAMAVRDRADVVEPLIGRNLLDKNGPVPPLPTLTGANLRDACRGDAALDALVLSRGVAGAYAARWDLPFAIPERSQIANGAPARTVQTLYLYRCADLR
jgi:hypothetical protein